MHNMQYMYIYDKYAQYAKYAQGPGLPAAGRSGGCAYYIYIYI